MKKNNKGMSLIEVLVAVSILSIVMAATTSLIIRQNKETQALTEKLVSLDLENILIQSLSDGSLCTRMLTDTTYDTRNPVVFDSSLIGTANPPEISLPNDQIVAGASATLTGGPFLVKKNQVFSNLAPGLIPISIKIANIREHSADTYSGEFIIDFDQSKIMRPIKSLRVSTTFKTDTSTPRRILYCGAKGVVTVVRSAAASAWRWPSVGAVCLPGEKVMGGGGSCRSRNSLGDARIYVNIPVTNGWYVKCDTGESQIIDAMAYVVCAP